MENPESKRITLNVDWRLPRDVLRVIFSKLPIVYLPACRLVCKSWSNVVLSHASVYEIISNTFFLCTSNAPEIHTFNTSSEMHCIDFDREISFLLPVEFPCDNWLYTLFANSCNGLLLIFKFGYLVSCAGILNPATKEYIKLPSVVRDANHYGRTNGIYSYGFGFSPKTKRYKVARVFFDIRKSITIFEILTFGGSKQWNCVESVPFEIRNNGVYFDGALYWIGTDRKNDRHEYVVCRFDVENEKVEATISLSGAGPSWKVSIGAFSDCIYATFFFIYPCCKLEVWMMHRYGGEESWTREFVIDDMPKDWMSPCRSTVNFKLIRTYEDGSILCLLNDETLLIYDPKFGSVKPLDELQFMKFSCVCPIESINFGSLQKILAGDDE